jgi:hypothetical protein
MSQAQSAGDAIRQIGVIDVTIISGAGSMVA